MKLTLVAILVLVAATSASGFLFNVGEIPIIGGLLEGLWDTFLTVGGNLVGISSEIMKDIFLFPLKIFQPETDTDHGHSLGMVKQCPALADVIFVVDASGSTKTDSFDKVINFNRRITEHFKIGPKDVRFGALVFSDDVREVFGLNDNGDHNSVAAALRGTPYLGGNTNTHKALEYILQHRTFDTRLASKIVVLITDGRSSSYTSTTNAASNVKNQGIEIIVVGIGAGISISLSSIASGQGGKNYFSPSSHSDLLRVEQSVAQRICQIPEEAGFKPEIVKPDCPIGHTLEKSLLSSKCVDIDECVEGHSCEQNCINAIGGYRCTCNAGYQPNAFDERKCDAVKACQAVADIVFVIDASGSMGSDNFKTQLDFASKLVTNFAIGSNGVNFGAMLFGFDVQKQFDLKDYTSASAISQALKSAPYLKGSATYTNKALNNLNEGFNMFGSEAGGRSDAEDIVILMTDGASSRKDLTREAATKVKSSGVRIVAVGIGAEVDTEEIEQIASTPEDAFQVASFELLTYIEQTLTERACST